VRQKYPIIYTYFFKRLISPAQAVPLAAYRPVYRHTPYRNIQFPTLYYTIQDTAHRLLLNILAGKQRSLMSGQTIDEYFPHI